MRGTHQTLDSKTNLHFEASFLAIFHLHIFKLSNKGRQDSLFIWSLQSGIFLDVKLAG